MNKLLATLTLAAFGFVAFLVVQLTSGTDTAPAVIPAGGNSDTAITKIMEATRQAPQTPDSLAWLPWVGNVA